MRLGARLPAGPDGSSGGIGARGLRSSVRLHQASDRRNLNWRNATTATITNRT